MNNQVPTIQDPTTSTQLNQQQLQQIQAAQAQLFGNAPVQQVPQVQSPWAGAAMLANALMSPTQNQGPGQGSTTQLQNLLSWLNGGNDMAGGPDDSDEDSAGS